MQRLLSLIICLVLIGSLAGCGAKTYSITTHTGQTYVSQGAPEYDVKSETYTFMNEDDKEVVINKNDIEIIKEQ